MSVQKVSAANNTNYSRCLPRCLLQDIFAKYFRLFDLPIFSLVSKNWNTTIPQNAKNLKRAIEQFLYPNFNSSIFSARNLLSYARADVRIYLDISDSMEWKESTGSNALHSIRRIVRRSLKYIPSVAICTFNEVIRDSYTVTRLQELAPLQQITCYGTTRLGWLLGCLYRIGREQIQNTSPVLTKIYVITDMVIQVSFIKKLKKFNNILDTQVEFVDVSNNVPETSFKQRLHQEKLPFVIIS